MLRFADRRLMHPHLTEQILIPALLISAAILGCSRIDIPLAVTIRSPNDGATLVVGQSFKAIADSDIDQPTDQVTTFEVELAGRSTGYQATWQLDKLFGTEPHILDESLLVPPNAPAGDDYVLSVSVLPSGAEIDEASFAFRDAIRVRVEASL